MHFDAANIQLRAGVKLRGIPSDLEIHRISKMEYFEEELTAFLLANGLPDLEHTRLDGWTHFLHLYTRVIQDCPLIISAKNNSTSTIDQVTVRVELANQPMGDDMPYKITWTVSDKNGQSGDIFVINSFQLTNPVP
jgi:hypothetical protein